ncbi:pyridoxamine 5'-phosphate oxidase family protein [Streptomyces bambusae]|uniref:pyridoxamine 5'-phosphate oxidase family protein n=1 Tax=Streptomyces bambusae TaxID=1550616 RepID=UPI001CFC6F75|nr:pyridoxamine 5'-phosphate oxidase family protein [Streptomyces bambusae]MCB5163926.1 pyridoxamine 5'-phosphate oxidase family protein [Streptomyces bambusae]
MTVPAERMMLEMSGTEALWLLEGAGAGHLVYVQREQAVVRPACHVLEHGRLIVRAPVQPLVVLSRTVLTYHCEDVRHPDGIGWTVTAHGPADPVTDRDEAAHYRRTLPGWAHGPHDTLLRMTPQSVTGFRLARPRVPEGR